VKLAIDASVAVAAAANPLGFERFRRFELVAPPLMWIESVSTLHAMLWRGELQSEQAEPMRDRVLAAPVRRREPDGLAQEAWKVADELGWAKTYDANLRRPGASPEMPARNIGRTHASGDCATRVCGRAN
jgi:hypothetical protein